jgi:hypothetical protein
MHAEGEHELIGSPSLVDRSLPPPRPKFVEHIPCPIRRRCYERNFDQNTLVVVRLPQYRNGHIVSIFVEGEHFVRRLEKQGNGDARAGASVTAVSKEGVM